ncbi:MAG: DUF262 domain-containing protein [Sulfurimonas sp.]|nr:DUF262 domain-containing protein [Sulfurimonas sp.]
MSIGEIINLYRDKEIDIHPEFQRIYRWTDSQKSKLIESILLGIPLPSIFVAQRDDGVWDVVDGLQRLSTIFSFLGIFEDENKKIVPPLKLIGTEYIPSLEGIYWSHSNPENEIPAEIKRAFKREKIDVKIIKKESDENAKYELFQRLNTGGSRLSEQEVRNCLLIMIDHKIYDWIKKLSENEHFRSCLPLTIKQEQEQAYMEIVLRFVVYRHVKQDQIKKYTDLTELLTDAMKTVFLDENFDKDAEEEIFNKVFMLLDDTLQDNSFKKYSVEKAKYLGPFSLSIFEVIAIGLSYSYKSDTELKDLINKTSKNLSNDEYFIDNTKYGTRSINRFSVLVKYGKEKFN